MEAAFAVMKIGRCGPDQHALRTEDVAYILDRRTRPR
jgi:hypothetical protein